MLLIASDHRGFNLKSQIVNHYKGKIEIEDCGCYSEKRIDFPDYCGKLCNSLLKNEDSVGILICGTGIGMSICANKFKGISCALCTSEEMVTMSRKHNNANVLALGANRTTFEQAKNMIDIFLTTKFINDEAYIRRNNKIKSISS